MIEQVLLLLSMLSIEIYLYVVRAVVGILPSVSESWYKMQEKGYGKKWFTLALWGLTGPIILISAMRGKWIMLAAGTLIALVAVMPAFKLNKYTKIVHYFGAFVGAPLALVAIWLDFDCPIWSYVTVSILLFGCLKLHPDKFRLQFRDNYMWIAEAIIIRSTYIYLFVESVMYYVFPNLI